jgi:hypothetical protein
MHQQVQQAAQRVARCERQLALHCRACLLLPLLVVMPLLLLLLLLALLLLALLLLTVLQEEQGQLLGARQEQRLPALLLEAFLPQPVLLPAHPACLQQHLPPALLLPHLPLHALLLAQLTCQHRPGLCLVQLAALLHAGPASRCGACSRRLSLQCACQ